MEHETVTKATLEAGAFFEDEEHNEILVEKDTFYDDIASSSHDSLFDEDERDLADQGIAPPLVVEADIRSEEITLADPLALDKQTEESLLSELIQRSLLQARLNYDLAAKNKRRRLADEKVHRSLLKSRLYIHDKMKLRRELADETADITQTKMDQFILGVWQPRSYYI